MSDRDFSGRLPGPVTGTATAPVVDKRVHRFLEHALFIPDDNVRSAQVEQSLQAVVAVDHPAVEIIQVGGGEPAAVQVHQGAQFRRNHRDTSRIIHSGRCRIFRKASTTSSRVIARSLALGVAMAS